MDFDFHTHRLDTPPGTGIVSLPQDIVRNPKVWTTYPSAQQFHPQGLYAAGIHPWWTLDKDFDLEEYKAGLSQLWDLPQVVQIGECGFDRLRGASLEVQWAVFSAQVAESERRELPMTLTSFVLSTSSSKLAKLYVRNKYGRFMDFVANLP